MNTPGLPAPSRLDALKTNLATLATQADAFGEFVATSNEQIDMDEQDMEGHENDLVVERAKTESVVKKVRGDFFGGDHCRRQCFFGELDDDIFSTYVSHLNKATPTCK
ncbi:hypothetical protein TL16_g08509 [Triparma laevis f. inornata]|uniref:Uncharacterized protein n=2 Tax=Triparma laevis TaxID=1534972 RepID=A0A9W7F5S8_9STRA|nr:hypothetical protein TL16_g08509 [Triparma laevis f. inornata]GMI02408.1 hypothetical protein TrLO_g14148 [Triparma laevis f. longispina]